MNDFETKVKNYIDENKMLVWGDRVVVGVSGGADSMALLSVLNALKDEYKLEIVVAHVNHGLRSEAADEASYVEKTCLEMGITYRLLEKDVEKESKKLSKGIEETGRKIRYDFFNELAGANGKIAVAHNENDVAETTLFRLFRGTGPKGLGGIEPVNQNIIRPLLGMSRQSIEEYLKDKGIKWCTDSSNLTDEYARNKVRNQILKYAEDNITEKSTSHVANAANLMRELNGFVEREVGKALNEALLSKSETSVVLDKAKLMKFDPYIKKAVIKALTDMLIPSVRDISSVHIDAAVEVLEKEGTKEVTFPYGLKFFSSYEKCEMRLCTQESDTQSEKVLTLCDNEVIIEGLGVVKTRVLPLKEEFVTQRKEYTKYFDYDKISSCLTVRHRRDRDYLTVDNKNSKQKLSDYFINEKIPKGERDNVFLVCDDNHVMWVIGKRISANYKISETTKKVLEISVCKEDQ